MMVLFIDITKDNDNLMYKGTWNETNKCDFCLPSTASIINKNTRAIFRMDYTNF